MEWQRDRESGSYAVFAFDFDISFMLEADILDDGESEPGAADLSGAGLVDTEKPLKDSVEELFRNPTSIIFDFDGGSIPC